MPLTPDDVTQALADSFLASLPRHNAEWDTRLVDTKASVT